MRKVFLVFFIVFAFGCSPSTRQVKPEPPKSYCFENKTTRYVVLGGLVGTFIWIAVESPEIAVFSAGMSLVFLGIDLVFDTNTSELRCSF